MTTSSHDALAIARELVPALAADAAARDLERRFPHAELALVKRSGLLALLVPTSAGGLGGTPGDLIRTTGILAEGDPSIAQMLITHHSGVELLNKLVPDAVRKPYYARIVAGELMLTNAFSEVGTKTIFEYRVRMSPAGDGGWRINGPKAYCTGSLGGEALYGLAITDEATPQPLVFLIETDAPGVVIHDDWTGMGQRTTASGTIEFTDAYVPAEHAISPVALGPTLDNFFGTMGQAMMSAHSTGIAKAALADAIAYVRTRARAWPHSGVERAAEDPYVQLRIGELHAQVESADALVERAIQRIEAAQANLMLETRVAASLAVAVAKKRSTEVVLEVCERLFEVCGAGATVAKYNFDRHWRNARTLTLHDPVDYKSKLIGDWLLTDTAPPISSHTP